MKHKHLTFMLAVLMSMVAGMVSAHDFEVDGIYYKITSSSSPYTVAVTYQGTSYSSYSNEYTGSVTIPESVTYNGNTYNVTSIGRDAFVGCSSLTSVTIPQSVTYIGISAFKQTGLTSVIIPESVTIIDGAAFSRCGSLTSVTIPCGITAIKTYAFDYCTSLTSVVIPNSVISIENYAFDGCSGLTSVTIPNSVTSIGRYAFKNTAWYNNQPNGVVYAGKVAYTYKGTMPEETSIVLEEGTVGIADGAFSGCSGLTSVIIPNSVTSIGSSAFNGTAWYNNQSDGLIYAGKVAYKYKGTMPKGTSVVLKEGTLGIAGSAFSGCTGLTSVNIPNSVTSIGSSAFSGCSGLTSVTIPNGVTTISNYAFQSCSDLTSVTIPNSVTSIGSMAFSGCTNLTSINCRTTTPPSCVSNCMQDVPGDCTIEVPVGCKEAYEAVSPWNLFTIIEMEYPGDPARVALSAEYSTFCSTKALDFTGVEGLRAYIASAYDTERGVLTLTRVYNVKARTGLILRGTKGETYEIPEGTGATTVANMLVGVVVDTELNPTEGRFTNFILAKDDIEGIGFYKVAHTSTLKAGKAYLQLPTDDLGSEVKGFRMMFDEDMSDGVETMHNAQCIMHIEAGAVYDLQGRLVAKPTKGIYIVNGKKTVIK